MIHAWYERISDLKDHVYFSLHEVTRQWQRGRSLPKFHNSVEIAVGLRGCVEITVNGELHMLREGDVCFMNSFEPHRYHYGDDCACYVILISAGFFNELNQWGSIAFPTYMPRAEGFAHIKPYLDYTYLEWDSDSVLCKRAFADTLAYLMAEYYPHFPRAEQGKQNALFLQALQYIYEHSAERLTVDEVAKKFGYSPNYFSAVFNERVGMSFPDYLNTCRMLEYTCLRGQRPELSVSETARLCGFGSMNTFYRTQRSFGAEGYDALDVPHGTDLKNPWSLIGMNDENSRGFEFVRPKRKEKGESEA
ncbi:MAG: helix-turn-helix domain-containing protein [Clostridia bacterium]|nr:helix-turn-helix domain-containing protein [Clostridia bacterium]